MSRLETEMNVTSQGDPAPPEPRNGFAFKSTELFKDQPSEYLNTIIVKRLAKARFQVYLVTTPSQGRNLALKVYPYLNGAISGSYVNESRFEFLSHENVIGFVHLNPSKSAMINSKKSTASTILMEYAPHGDLYELTKNNLILKSETLIRTLFRQIIQGVEYLHQNNVAHLDLKPENILIGNDFELKICDFDLSYREGDKHIFSEGTPFFGAPELSTRNCKNPYKADIYSMGAILFYLITGGCMPKGNYNGGLYEYLQNKEAKWLGGNIGNLNKEVTELILGMVKTNPDERLKINQIKESKWFAGPVFSESELAEVLNPECQ